MTDALLVDVKEAARLLGISTSMIYDLASEATPVEQRLPTVRLGRRVLFSLDALRDWIRAQQVAA